MTYDIAIVGGGITGAGIARDAALRGLRVALFERDDFGSGTSSKSSKLIHGGLRYLEHGEFGLVFESVSERQVQRHVAPHIVRPLPFLVPIYAGLKPGLETMNIGLWIYDTLALFRSEKMHRTVRGAKASKLEPALLEDGLRGAIEYYDCITDDARLVLENILDARDAGAECCSYSRVTEFLYHNGGHDHGKVRGVRVCDALSGTMREVSANAVIVAAGAWTDEIAQDTNLDHGRHLLRRTKGVHIVFPREKLPLRRAITLISPVDGRVIFAIPWKQRTVLGTTDTDYEGRADDCHASAEDVAYLCEGANRYFPRAKFSPRDVIATWSGLRPLIRDADADSPGAVSREHEIFVRDDGIIVIAGGKLTTYRRMAKEVVKKAIRWLDYHYEAEIERRDLQKPGTKTRPLPGAAGLAKRSMTGVLELAHALGARGIDDEAAQHLAYTYGVRAELIGAAIEATPALGERLQPDLPYLWAEVDFAVQCDLARTVSDILDRRVPLLLTGRDQGLDVVERVAARAAELLGWDAARTAEDIDAYRSDVADSRRFRAI